MLLRKSRCPIWVENQNRLFRRRKRGRDYRKVLDLTTPDVLEVAGD